MKSKWIFDAEATLQSLDGITTLRRDFGGGFTAEVGNTSQPPETGTKTAYWFIVRVPPVKYDIEVIAGNYASLSAAKQAAEQIVKRLL